MMNKDDLLLMVMAAGEGAPLTPVQLQKSLFLISENLKGTIESTYSFMPYHYGPFDAEVYSDADSLEAEGFLYSARSPRGTWVDRAITPKGLLRAEELRKEVPEPIRQYVEDVVKWTQSLSFSSLVKAIYDQYPSYRKNSVFQG